MHRAANASLTNLFLSILHTHAAQLCTAFNDFSSEFGARVRTAYQKQIVAEIDILPSPFTLVSFVYGGRIF